MPDLFIFLFKVNAALLLFCAGYYLVLRRLTFYTLNRIYLVTAILFATVYPQINLNNFALRHQQIAKPVQVILSWQGPAGQFIQPLSQPSYWYWAGFVFWIIAAGLAIRLLTQLFSLYKLYRASEPSCIFGHDVRLIKTDAGPFSFWKSIYVNPVNHSAADLKAILLHEQVHVDEWHTLDILLAELSTIFYWFNPGVWLMKKAVRENIEFITDRKILNAGINSKQYQYSLVNVSFAATSNNIVNNFNISTIKKRIIMMNTKRSSKINLTRYGFIVPAIIALLLVFSFSNAAFIKRTDNAYQVLAKTVNNFGSKITAAAAPAPTVKKKADTTAKPGKAQLVIVATPNEDYDTIKKAGITLITSTHSDSINYVIDGKKSTKADFANLDPKITESIEIIAAGDAKGLFDGSDNGNNTVLITTSGSAAGRALRQKIHALKGNKYTLASSVAAGTPAATTTGYVSLSDSPEAKSAKLARGNTYIKRSAAPAVISTHGLIAATAAPVIVVEPNVHIYTSNDSIFVTPATTNTSATAYTIATDNKSYSKTKKTPYTINYDRPVKGAYSYYKTTSANTNIDHLSAKLIFINDKEASAADLRKLSAADIESMSTKNDDYTRYQYGDKGKNGVVYIYTKKKK